jgi:two-component system osmolarity sensor histidine kinase EnvZ
MALRLWPRTLLWRSVLLIAALLVVAHLAWLQIFRASELEPRALQSARELASVVNLTRAALVTADPVRRYDLLDELAQREGIQIYIGDPAEAVPALPQRPLLRIIERELRERLSAQTRLTLEREGIAGVWVSFRIDGDEYWVTLPRARIERNVRLRWIGWGALALALAVLGAVLIVARINRPLRELTRAAALLGRGAVHTRVAEAGPEEIRGLARAFNQMAADIQRQDEERALLLAGVSHDLRTPLSRIRIASEMLGGDGGLKSGIAQDIADIDAAIGQFLDFARPPEAERMADAGDLNAVVAAAVERYARDQRPVHFIAGAPRPMPLRAQALQRLVANLVENALRHGNPPVEVRTGRDGDCNLIEVLDRGPGIPPAEAARMLQPFTRMDNARSTSGTGLGLAIVERIARLHGGEVRLLAREGGGLRVTVTLRTAA